MDLALKSISMAEALTSFGLWQMQAKLGLTFAPGLERIAGVDAVLDVKRFQSFLADWIQSRF